MMASIDLKLLGGFQVQLAHGVPVRVPTRKAQALLAYLALPCGLAHPRDKVTSLLWGGMREGQARRNLRQTLFTIRKALPVTAPDGLRLDAPDLSLVPAAFDVDVARFEGLLMQGTPHALAQAAALYRGDLLQGLAVQEAPFEEWLMAERERLRELALETLAKLLAQQRMAGATEVALQTALRLLALDPLLETVHRAVMRLYAQLGRRDAALRQYQTCIAVLQRELGVEPEEETRRLYREIVAARHLPPPAATEPAVTSSMSRADIPQVRPVTPPSEIRLVGREPGMACVREAMSETSVGCGRLVAILGETGMGKTRLVSELVTEALQASSHHVLLGRCHEGEQMVPFAPWADAFRRGHVNDLLLRLQKDPPWRTELARLLPELDWHNADRGVAPPDNLRLFEAVAQLLGLLASTKPLLVVVEDLHWADEMSLRLLGYLGHRVERWPILLIATARLDELAEALLLRSWLQGLEREPSMLRLVLAPLTRAETGMIVRMLARPGMPRDTMIRLAEQIWRMSEGNPFVIIETMRALPHEPVVSATADVPLPSCVREATARRLDQLTKEAHLLAGVAAVIGRDFDFRLTLSAAGLEEAAAIDAVEELVRRHILQGHGDRFAFIHDRVREVVYSRLLVPRRRLLHRGVAEALESLHATNPEPHLVALGLHYHEGEVWAKAASYLRAAAAAASAHAAYREARGCLEQALVSARHLPDERATTELVIDLRLELYQPLLSLGELPRLLETLCQAETLAGALHDERRLGQVWSGMAQYFRLMGDPGRAIDAGERALATARALGDLGLEADTNYRLAQAYRSRGHYREAAGLLTRNIELVRPNLRGVAAPAASENAILSRIQLSFCHSELGEIGLAITVADEALHDARTLDRMDLIAGAHCALGMAYLANGEFDTASAILEESVRVSGLQDFQVWRAWAESPLGEAHTLGGRVAAAVVRLERAVKHASFLKHSQAMRVVNLGQAYLWHGRLQDAKETALHALFLARQHQERGHEAWALRLLGEVNSRGAPPDMDAARTNYDQALAQAEELGMRPLSARCHLGLGALHRDADDSEQAERHLATAMRLFREMGMHSWLLRTQRLLDRGHSPWVVTSGRPRGTPSPSPESDQQP